MIVLCIHFVLAFSSSYLHYLLLIHFRLEDEGDFERAAAIAVFRVKIRQAIEVLHKGAEVQTGTS